MPSPQKLDTHHKSLIVNLDPSTFGSCAEIGADRKSPAGSFSSEERPALWPKRFPLTTRKSATISTVPDRATYPTKRLEAMQDNEWNHNCDSFNNLIIHSSIRYNKITFAQCPPNRPKVQSDSHRNVSQIA